MKGDYSSDPQVNTFKELKKRIQESEDKLTRAFKSKMVKMVVRWGTTLENLLFDKSPRAWRWCGKEK